MKFLRNLLGRKQAPAQTSAPAPAPIPEMTAPKVPSQPVMQAVAAAAAKAPRRPDTSLTEDTSTSKMLKQVAAKMKDEDQARADDPAGIWDLDGDAAPAPAAEAAPRAPARKRRTKTRLIGFDTSEGDVVDLFKEAPAAAPVQRARFPVGWMLVVEGPGRGECFALQNGLSQIGRGDDQAVQLDFGDSAISRQNHAAIVYDPAERTFLLGQGGKSNIVRLNNTPVIANEPLKTGDKIKIGETVLEIVTFCGPDFDWADGDTTDDEEGDEDVAIA